MDCEYVGEFDKKDIDRKIKIARKEGTTNICIMCGGKSFEHDISILTAQIIANGCKNKYNVFVLYQSLGGEFYLQPKDIKIKDFKDLSFATKVKLILNSNFLYNGKSKPLFRMDFVINCLHGQNAEDGTFAHLFNLCNVPCTSFNATSLAITLDKEFMKDCFKASGFNTPDYCVLKSDDYSKIKADINRQTVKNIEDLLTYYENSAQKSVISKLQKIGFPMIVKPANLGSSIGICTCNNFEQLIKAFDFAFKFDSKVICEKMLVDFIEINCSARKVHNKIEASKCEEPIKHSAFLTFSDKYLCKNKGGKTKLHSVCGNPSVETLDKSGGENVDESAEKIEKINKNSEKNDKSSIFEQEFVKKLENMVKATKFLHSDKNGIVEDEVPSEMLKKVHSLISGCFVEENQVEEINDAKYGKEDDFVKLSQHSVPQCVIDSIRETTCQLYKKFDCENVIRVDYLVDEQYNVYVNEINSIPGSLAYYLWDEDIGEFIDSLIIDAYKNFKNNQNKNYYFDTQL